MPDIINVTNQVERLDIIGFRGIALNGVDYRHIFATGFQQKRDSFTDDPYEMHYKSFVNDHSPRAGDMASISANCVSTRIANAALFPNDTTVEWTWIFAVYVQDGFNTYERQQLDAWQVIDQRPELFTSYQLQRVTWPIYAEEFAAESIPARHVLGCVRCQRQWTGGDWHLGGTFILDDTLYWNSANIDGTLAPVRVNRIKDLMKAAIRQRVGDIPMTNE